MNRTAIVSLALGAAVFTVLLWIIGAEQIFRQILSIPAELVVFFLALTMVFYALRAVRWRILLQHINPPSIRTAFWTTMIGYMVNAIIPIRVGGEIVRAYIINWKEKVGLPQSLSSVAVERVLDLLAILALAAGSLTFLPAGTQLPKWMFQAMQAIGVLVLLCLVALGFAAFKSRWLLARVEKFASRLPFLGARRKEKLGEFLKLLVEGATSTLRHPLAMAATMILTFVIWAILFASIYVFFIGFGIQASIPLILLGVMIFQLTFILPSSPGGLGTFEAAWIIIFTGLGLPQVDQMLAIALVTHFGNLILVLALGSAGIALLGLTFGEVIQLPLKRRVT